MANTKFFGSRAWKKFVNYAYNIGASIVIIGAMMKITHYPGGDLVITIGLVSEAILFFLTALDPLPDEYHWEKVYPELLEEFDSSKTSQRRAEKASAPEEGVGLTRKMDEMLQQAGIEAALFQNLSSGIRNLEKTLEENVAKLSSTADVEGFSRKYSEELAKASQNMETLNALYSAQLENADKQLEVNRQAIQTFAAAMEDSQKLNREMQALTENLSSLNSVYGGMLSAMNPKR